MLDNSNFHSEAPSSFCHEAQCTDWADYSGRSNYEAFVIKTQQGLPHLQTSRPAQEVTCHITSSDAIIIQTQDLMPTNQEIPANQGMPTQCATQIETFEHT
jgi:hypothetical protein